MVLDDPFSLRILVFLASRYLPVMSDWVDTAETAGALGVLTDDVEQRYPRLLAAGLIEVSPADDENEQSAALITVKGLLAIGRVP